MTQTPQQIQFATLITSHKGIIYRILRSYQQDDRFHDDLFQDILVRAWNSFGDFRWECSFSTWLHYIAKSVICNHVRNIRNKLKIVYTNNVFYEIIDEPYSEVNLPVIDSLSEKEKLTLQMRLEGFSFEQISAKTGEPVSRLLVRMHRIKQRLSKSIKS